MPAPMRFPAVPMTAPPAVLPRNLPTGPSQLLLGTPTLDRDAGTVAPLVTACVAARPSGVTGPRAAAPPALAGTADAAPEVTPVPAPAPPAPAAPGPGTTPQATPPPPGKAAAAIGFQTLPRLYPVRCPFSMV